MWQEWILSILQLEWVSEYLSSLVIFWENISRYIFDYFAMLWKWPVFLPVSSSLFSFFIILWLGIKEHVICTRRSSGPGDTVRCTIYSFRYISSTIASFRSRSIRCSNTTLPSTSTCCLFWTYTISRYNSGRTILGEPKYLAHQYYSLYTRQIQGQWNGFVHFLYPLHPCRWIW